MTNLSSIVTTMAETGCTPEQIAAVVNAVEEKKQEKRAYERDKKRRQRAQVSENKENVSPGHSGTTGDTDLKEKEKRTKKEKETPPIPKENPPTGVKRKGCPPRKAERLENFMAREFPDGEIPQEWGQWAYDELGLTEEEINFEWEKFRDYWIGVGGAKSRKSDWLATWRNWCRRKYEEKKRKAELNGIYSSK